MLKGIKKRMNNIKNILMNGDMVLKNPSVEDLIEMVVSRKEGVMSSSGAVVTKTGERTGRSPNDRYIVRNKWSDSNVHWGNVNVPVSKDIFYEIFDETVEYLKKKHRFVLDSFVGANEKYRMPIRLIAEKSWHVLLASSLFITPRQEDLKNFQPKFTIIDAMDFSIDYKKYGLRSGTFVALSFEDGIILIVGSGYGGEIKKSVFSVMNGILPKSGVLPMHCSANVGKNGDVALFFGLSGTGKTTLSADPKRRLIGDDEHGWCDDGVFNFEGGCYAKVIKLSKKSEPQIYGAIRRGSVLENVVLNDDGTINFNDSSITENTRVTYPISHIPESVESGTAGHPKNIIFLACDAFGVLPPISKLTPEMAMYHFLSGYTAKLAGTEVGVNEPIATFSECFGAPFMPLNPIEYAKLLGKFIKKHDVSCWLINSGWSGGPYGEGERMSIKLTRNLVNAAFSGFLDDVSYHRDNNFSFLVPESCPNVESSILNPKNTWSDKNAYDDKARKLAGLFIDNFKKFEKFAGEKIIYAGPQII